MPDFEYERACAERGFRSICGIDEAGRGPLAGPVCAAAVIFPTDCVIEGLNDSKKLSAAKREKLYDIIVSEAICFGIAFASVEEIERLNILGATYLAMCRAAEKLSPAADFALIDGNRTPPELAIPSLTVVKGDAKSCSIAAASVLAKVTRDRLMLEYDAIYPQYGFSKHMGYGTEEHRNAILKYGASEIHRPSFLKKLYEKQQS